MPTLEQTLRQLEFEAGGPGSGRHKGDVTLYHGTSHLRALRIINQGLSNKQNRSFSLTRKGFVYVTPNLSRAKDYAGETAFGHGGKLAIVEFAVPKAMFNKMSVDPEDKIGNKSRGGLMYKGSIPAKYVTGYRIRNDYGFNYDKFDK